MQAASADCGQPARRRTRAGAPFVMQLRTATSTCLPVRARRSLPCTHSCTLQAAATSPLQPIRSCSTRVLVTGQPPSSAQACSCQGASAPPTVAVHSQITRRPRAAPPLFLPASAASGPRLPPLRPTDGGEPAPAVCVALPACVNLCEISIHEGLLGLRGPSGCAFGCSVTPPCASSVCWGRATPTCSAKTRNSCCRASS